MKPVVERAKEVLRAEVDGIHAVHDSLGEEFARVVEECEAAVAAGGKLVLTGIGKSAHISRKTAATLISTGTPAVFLYPVESMHGDLGMLAKGDLVLAVSYSGETNELLAALPAMKALGHKVVAVTGNAESRLARCSDLVLPMKVPGEACPFGLAPTTSTTVLLALGDALAIILMERRGFTKRDYGMLHPAGAIGRSLTLKAVDVMHPFTGTLAELEPGSWTSVEEQTMAVDVLKQMNDRQVSTAVILGRDSLVKGVVYRDDLKSFKI